MSGMSGTCDDAETAAAVAAALAEEMGRSRELSSLLSNGGKVRTPVLSNEILMVFTGGRQRRRTRGCSDARIANDLDISQKQKGTRKHQGSSGLTSDGGLLSPPKRPLSHTANPGEPEERPDLKDQLISSAEKSLATGLLESVDFLGVDAASQATIAALLDEDFRASRESAQLLRGGEVKEIYEHLAFSFGSVGSRRRYTRSAAQRVSSDDHAGKDLSGNQLASPSADVSSATPEELKARHADKLPRVAEVETTSPGISFSKADTGSNGSHRTMRTYRRRAEAGTGPSEPRVAVKRNSRGETSEEVSVPEPEPRDGGFSGSGTPSNGETPTATKHRGRQRGAKRVVRKREAVGDTLEASNGALGGGLSRLAEARNENSGEAEGETAGQERGAKTEQTTADAAVPHNRGPQAADDGQMQPEQVLRQRKEYLAATACPSSRQEQEEMRTRRSLLDEDSSSNETQRIMRRTATKRELEPGGQQKQSRQVVQCAEGTAPLSQEVEEEGQLADSTGRNESDSDRERTRDCEVVKCSRGTAVPKQERHIESGVESGATLAVNLSTGMAQAVELTDWRRKQQKRSERSLALQGRAGGEAVSEQLGPLDTETAPDGMGAVISKRPRASQPGPHRGMRRAEREAPDPESLSGRASLGERELGDSLLPSSKRKRDEIASSLRRGAKNQTPGRSQVARDTVVEDASTTSEEGSRDAKVCVRRSGGRQSRSLHEICSREPSGEDLARDSLHQGMADTGQGLRSPTADNGIQVCAEIGHESAASRLLPDPGGEDLGESRGEETGEARQRQGQKKWRREANEEDVANAPEGRRATRETSSTEEGDSERRTAAEVEESPHRFRGREQKRMEETRVSRTGEAPPPPTSAESPRKLVIRRRPVKPKVGSLFLSPFF